MNGADYVATVRLTNKAGDVLAMPGDTCERVPDESLPWLFGQGLIATLTAWASANPASPALPAPAVTDADGFHVLDEDAADYEDVAGDE
jgi:hypothetical protein